MSKAPFLWRLGSALQAFAVTMRGGGLKAAGSDNVVAYSTVSTWDEDRPVAQPYDYTAASREGYMGNEVVYSVVSDIAESAAEPTMRVYEDDQELVDHPARRLMVEPNPVQSEFEMWELLLIHLMLAGNAFLQKIRSRSGAPVQLWPINPGRMYPVPDRETFIREWRYRMDDGSTIPVAREDVIHVKMPHPLNAYLGLAPMVVGLRAVRRDTHATNFIESFFENAAVPQGLIKMKHRVEQDEADRIRQVWRARYGGRRGWHDVAVLDADTEYQRLGLTQDEMGMPDLTDLSETRICMIFKWPPVLIGALSGLKRATYSNIATARRIAWEDTLSPIYQRLESRINADLAREFGWVTAARPFRWDYSLVKALRVDEDGVWQRAREAFLAGGITRNEYRSLIGLDQAPGDDVYMVNMGQVAVPQGGGAPRALAQPESEQAALAYPAVERLGDLFRERGNGRRERV